MLIINMTKDEAYQLATEHYKQSILDNMGLFMIAEAWGIKPWAVTQYEGHGVLTEAYVIDEMTKQVLEMFNESNVLQLDLQSIA